MVHTGLGQIHIRLCRQSALLPRQQRQQKARIVTVKQGANPCLHSVSQPDRPPPGRALTPRTEAGCSPAVGHQEHTLGVEHRHIIVPNPGGTLQIDVLRHPLPGTKLQKRRIAVIDELSRQPPLPAPSPWRRNGSPWGSPPASWSVFGRVPPAPPSAR